MPISKSMFKGVLASVAVLAAAGVGHATPVSLDPSLLVFSSDGTFHSGITSVDAGSVSSTDFLTYSVSNIVPGGPGFFTISFTPTESGYINFSNGTEANSSNDYNLSLTDVTLSDGSTALSGNLTTSTTASGGRQVDAFNGIWGGLVSGTTYTLKVAYDIASATTQLRPDTFAGQISFGVLPLPSSALLFCSGIAGLALLAWRRKPKTGSSASI
jgi:hypothetical protein